jgi:hypothetical protein
MKFDSAHGISNTELMCSSFGPSTSENSARAMRRRHRIEKLCRRAIGWFIFVCNANSAFIPFHLHFNCTESFRVSCCLVLIASNIYTPQSSRTSTQNTLEWNYPLKISLFQMDVIRIQRTAKRASATWTSATIREQQSLNQRIQSVGCELAQVEQTLTAAFGKLTMSTLMDIGKRCVEYTGGQVKPDRLARRHRQGMLCFCCANWDVISRMILADARRQRPPNTPVFESPSVRMATPFERDPLSITALLNR